MKKYFKIIILIFVSNMLFSIANAGSDGSLEKKTNLVLEKLMIVSKNLIEEFLHSIKD